MRLSRRRVGVIIGFVLSCVGAPAFALPDPNEPVDPTKRAQISTRDAVRPSATPVNGDGVVGGRVIRRSEIPIRRSALADNRAAVDVRETRQKERVLKPSARTQTVRRFEVRRASERPASIPRIDPDRFRRMLRDYERDRVPAASLVSGEIQVGKDRVSLADINRFASPRAALEAQGIPVTAAASGEAAESNSTPVPVSRDDNATAH